MMIWGGRSMREKTLCMCQTISIVIPPLPVQDIHNNSRHPGTCTLYPLVHWTSHRLLEGPPSKGVEVLLKHDSWCNHNFYKIR